MKLIHKNLTSKIRFSKQTFLASATRTANGVFENICPRARYSAALKFCKRSKKHRKKINNMIITNN